MDIQTILSQTDNTILRPDARRDEIETCVRDAVSFGMASACVASCRIQDGVALAKGRVPLCAVIGFPHGNCTTGTKLFEAEQALADGAQELDMVINIGWLKEDRFDAVFEEILSLRELSRGHVLKVIVETCLLNEAEKLRMCDLVARAEADFIKTSTGYAIGGAEIADIELFRKRLPAHVQIKASGGIQSFAQAQTFLEAGATRVGASRLAALAKGLIA